MSDGKKHDVKAAKEITFPSGSILVMDKGYIDFKWMNNLDSNNVFFVTRAKENMQYETINNYPIADKEKGIILEDLDVKLTEHYSSLLLVFSPTNHKCLYPKYLNL